MELLRPEEIDSVSSLSLLSLVKGRLSVFVMANSNLCYL